MCVCTICLCYLDCHGINSSKTSSGEFWWPPTSLAEEWTSSESTSSSTTTCLKTLTLTCTGWVHTHRHTHLKELRVMNRFFTYQLKFKYSTELTETWMPTSAQSSEPTMLTISFGNVTRLLNVWAFDRSCLPCCRGNRWRVQAVSARRAWPSRLCQTKQTPKPWTTCRTGSRWTWRSCPRRLTYPPTVSSSFSPHPSSPPYRYWLNPNVCTTWALRPQSFIALLPWIYFHGRLIYYAN